MTAKKRFLSALLGGRVDRIPVACVNQTATVFQMERLGAAWPQAHTDPEQMALLSAGAYTVLGLELVRVPFDQTVEAEILGCPVKMGGMSDIPSLSGHPIQEPGDPLRLPSDIAAKGRIPVAAEAVRLLKARFGAEVAVMGGVVGPFTITGALLGTEQLLVTSLLEPEVLEPYLEKAVEVAAAFAGALVEAGADVICIEDMTASTDMIRPDTFRKLVSAYQKELISRIPVPTVLHICGNVEPIVEEMAATGADGLSIEEKTDLAAARRKVGGKAALIGPIDPSGQLLGGTPESVRQASLAALEAGIDILAPGCAIPPHAPESNLKAMIDTARGYQAKDKAKAASVVVMPETVSVFTRYDVTTEKGETSLLSGLTDPLLAAVADAVIRGQKRDTVAAVELALREKDALEVIHNGLVAGIDKVGRLWDEEYYFLPQVILAADAMKIGIAACEKEMGHAVEKKGKIIMHVAQGDVHTIGKDIVKALFVANGFEVIDLGVDVPVEKVVQAVKDLRPHLLVGSALMTTTMTAFPRIAQRLEEERIEIPFACGGGAVNQHFCESFRFGIFGGKGNRAAAIAQAAAEGKSWEEMRAMFHK